MSDEGYEIFLMDLEDYKAELEEEDEEWVQNSHQSNRERNQSCQIDRKS